MRGRPLDDATIAVIEDAVNAGGSDAYVAWLLGVSPGTVATRRRMGLIKGSVKPQRRGGRPGGPRRGLRMRILARIVAGLRNHQIADELGCSRQYVSMLRRGRS